MEEWKSFHKSNIGRSEKTQTWYISNYGRVKIVNDSTKKIRYPKLSKISTNRHSGYLAISINNAPEKYVHRLVARYFIENPENKKTVNHIDGNKENNHVDNLEWATYQENLLHAWYNGFYEKVGKFSGNVHISTQSTEDEFMALMCKCDAGSIEYRICALRASGLAYREIAEQLNIPLGTISNKIHRLRK